MEAIIETNSAENTDEFETFLSETLIAVKRARTKTSSLYAQYEKWTEANGNRPVYCRTFVGELRKRYEIRRDSIRGNVVYGFALKSDINNWCETLSPAKAVTIGEPSTDWVVVTLENDEAEKSSLTHKSAQGVLRVKTEPYEFEADADFPMAKLAELLHRLDGDVLC